jgi:hypothetical protein
VRLGDAGDGSGRPGAASTSRIRTWAEKAGEFVPSMKRFSQTINGRGFEPKRNGTGKAGFSGIEVGSWAL